MPIVPLKENSSSTDEAYEIYDIVTDPGRYAGTSTPFHVNLLLQALVKAFVAYSPTEKNNWKTKDRKA